MLKESLLNIIKLFPPARNYLDQKHGLLISIKNLENENKYLHKVIKGLEPVKRPVFAPIFIDDIILAQSQKERTGQSRHRTQPPFTLNWVVPTFSSSSGGLSDIYRTISYLESRGHKCRVYIYDTLGLSSLSRQRDLLAGHIPHIKAEVFYNSSMIKDCDAIFATNWPSAYPVHNFKGKGKKYYYVQDFETYFEPAGAMRQLADDTYKFGFHGLTLGEWLSEKLSSEYGMGCDYFDFGYDSAHYSLTNKTVREDVLFYAQPEKARRGFELGIMALEIFHAQNPRSKIHLFGADVGVYKLPFPFINHGVLSVGQINDLYNKCAAGLALSFTNISLIPLEMLASGCVPVINDSYHTRKIKYSDKVIYAEPSPKAIAGALDKALKTGLAKNNKLPLSYGWDHSNKQIEDILIRDLASAG